jgi:hypothetical protein
MDTYHMSNTVVYRKSRLPFKASKQPVIPQPNEEVRANVADSDQTGHLFRSMSDSVPENPDSHRSEATLQVSDIGVSGLSQGFHA